MINRELYINDSLIDLPEEVEIALTFQVNDIAQMEDRQANFSNQFELPVTNHNRLSLGFSEIVSSSTYAPYRQLKCSYYENGVALIDNGYAIIEGYTDVFSVTIYSGIFDFFEQIKDRSIQELDFSEYDHDFTMFEIKNINDADLDISWALIQYGSVNPSSNEIDIRYLNPQISLDTIIKKIIAVTTYTVTGNIFGQPEYKGLRMTLDKTQALSEESVILARTVKAYSDNNFNASQAGATNIFTIGFNSNYYHPYDNVPKVWYNPYGSPLKQRVINLLSLFKDTSVVGNQGNALPFQAGSNYGQYPYSNDQNYYKDAAYVAPYKMVLDLHLHFYARGSQYGYDPFFTEDLVSIFIVINDAYGIDNGFAYNNPGNPSPYNQYITFSKSDGLIDYTKTGIRLNPGDRLKVYIRVEAPIYSGQYLQIYGSGFKDPLTFSDKSYIEFKPTQSSAIGEPISYNSMIPDISMTSIMKNFANQFGVIFSSTNKENQLKCTQFKDVARSLKVNDWSKKIAGRYSLNYRIGNYAFNNKMMWDPSNIQYGDSDFIINDTTLEKNAVLIQMDYAAAQPVNRLFNPSGITKPLNGNTGVSLDLYTPYEADSFELTVDYIAGEIVKYNGIIYECIADSYGITPPSNGVKWVVYYKQFESTIDFKPTLVYIRTLGGPLYYSDGATSLSASAAKIAYFKDEAYPYSLHFKDIQDTHYVEFIQMLNKLKYIKIPMYLTKKDIKEIDFTIPIYLDVFQGNFYLNKISEYQANQPCTVELILL